MTQHLELRNLEAFVTVADEGSFTAAAKTLHSNQPAISTRIATLEAQLGTRLIDRGARLSGLTPAGDILLPHARAILRETANARLAIERFLGEPHGTLQIGASTVPGSYLLPGVLAKLLEALPDVRVQLTVQGTRDTLETLRRHEIELAVVGRAVVGDPEIETSEVAQDEIVLVASPEFVRRHRLRGADASRLKTLPMVLREPGSATRATTIEHLEAHGVDADALEVALEVLGNEAVRSAALAGLGVAFISRLAVEGLILNGELTELYELARPIRRSLFLALRRGRTLSPAAAALADLLRSRGD